MKSFTIVAAIGGTKYLDLFLRTNRTWQLKQELHDVPLLLFYNNIDVDRLKHLSNVTFVPWDMGEVGMRERMLSAFVFAAKYVQTDFYLKIDADCYFTDASELVTPDLFTYDIVGQRWGYTKPAIWIEKLDQWATQLNLPGSNLNPVITSNVFGHKRFTSWLCMHKTEFVKQCLAYTGDRLPIPSHDTFLWYMANRMNYKWGRHNFTLSGAAHKRNPVLPL